MKERSNQRVDRKISKNMFISHLFEINFSSKKSFFIFDFFWAIWILEKPSFLTQEFFSSGRQSVRNFFLPIVVNYQDEIRDAGQIQGAMERIHHHDLPL